MPRIRPAPPSLIPPTSVHSKPPPRGQAFLLYPSRPLPPPLFLGAITPGQVIVLDFCNYQGCDREAQEQLSGGPWPSIVLPVPSRMLRQVYRMTMGRGACVTGSLLSATVGKPSRRSSVVRGRHRTSPCERRVSTGEPWRLLSVHVREPWPRACVCGQAEALISAPE